MKSIFIVCSLGISGDMLASALFDLGVPHSIFLDNLVSLNIDKNYKLKFEAGDSDGIKGIVCKKNEIQFKELSRSLMFKQKSQSYLCLSRSQFSIVINDSFQDAEMRQLICRDLPKLHFSHSVECSALKNFRPKFQTGVSELCLSRNRFVL